MKLEDLKPLLYSDDLEALRQRLAYAKELLVGPEQWENGYNNWLKTRTAFIEKLTEEGL